MLTQLLAFCLQEDIFLWLDTYTLTKNLQREDEQENLAFEYE